MNLLFMSNGLPPYGIPRSGLIAIFDPWRDTYGRNILPVGSENFVTGWSAIDSSVVTITQNQTVGEWNTAKATRIQATGGGGTTTTKYIITAVYSAPSGVAYCESAFVKNIGSNPVIVANNLGGTVTVAVNESKKIEIDGTGNGANHLGVQLRADAKTNGFDIVVYQPQINLSTLYPYAPPSGLPQSTLDYSGHGNTFQLGSTAGSDTNDPKYNGVALVGDGVDDYAIASFASAAYRISIVDSGSGYTFVNEVPAYLDLFKTGASTYLNDKIGPTAYYNRVLTAGEIAQAKAGLKRYMASKGVTVS